MKRDTLFADAGQAPARFEFNEEVAEVFDDMLSRSVPFYSAQQDLFAGLAARFGPPGATVYELGCSTGATLLKLAEAVAPPVRLVGYDYSEAMLKQARSKAGANGLTGRIELRYGDLNSDPRELALEHAGVIVLAWTLQFVRPARREPLVSHLFQALSPGGVLIVAEKVRPDDPALDETWIETYESYKRNSGYSQAEIDLKRRALRDVLMPYRIGENIALLRRCGFPVVELVFFAYGFAAFLCLREPAEGH